MTANRRIVRRDAVEARGDWPASWPPLLRRVHAARGSDARSAMPRLVDLLPFAEMRGIDAAVDLLRDAINRDARILVVGDFDCDGATACAVGVRGLRMLGAKHVMHAVPNRIVHGYGMTPGLVEELAALQPELVVTVDHGIACHAGINAAKARGWQVLVTDHHLPGPTLPAADAIVNPNQPGDSFASKAMAGVGVIFYLLLALRARLGATADLTSLLDLVAVGTVADMVPLDANNRALIGAGLRRLRAGQGCAGLRALIDVSGRRETTLSPNDIGFAIGPRINAAGRLEDMGIGIECLLTDDVGHARQLAAVLHGINEERRAVQGDMQEVADSRVDGVGSDAPAACLFDEAWHPGVVGLVASKLKERLHRPAIAFAPVESGGTALRGSARSIPGFHIRDALALVDARHPGLIDRFGGHAMAAGLSLQAEAFPAFRDAFLQVARDWLTDDLLTDVLRSDGELSSHDFHIDTALALRDGGHWGQGYAEPLFDGEFEVLAWRIVGERHLKLELGMGHQRLNAIHFGGWDGDAPPSRLRIAYRLAPDDYRGGGAIQLLVVHREPASASLPA
ncbi:single-stranded-DNA-specific exonuclease RecJ [Thermomonas carbonis]|uniref:Single-stranded-DNA-specific exonuclease RecJ n=1 Tax=Thermomonas carbonis TaxID=1463158 RepID=A0A7G9SNZ1_9GAMM|nr:single-stranded-DNA-specific exonuclease RecJ [Thermomonas carbonis]QNN69566.1 single-stranded-DNA-specific exonuclease RecJ [Thermomonas carbonis]GHB93936.1 single-stranded-DNA-specific exonuclease RecJ [Thermomonas carbonis]